MLRLAVNAKGLNRLAATAPPEAILTPHLYPGACWPMAGSTGQVTLRLHYPVKVRAVTLDHAPASLFADVEQRKSAPRKVRVFGYPPCWTKKAAAESDYLKDDAFQSSGPNDYDVEYLRGVCADGLDFDVKKPIVLHDFEYNMTGPSIQTFYIPLPEKKEAKDDEGSCSDGNFLFSAPDRSDSINEGVGAIRLLVTNNWGNPDYTCIYRFRIHGDVIGPNDD